MDSHDSNNTKIERERRKNMLVRPRNAAKYLDIGLSTFWLYVSQGKIKTIKLSDRVTVVHKDELERFVNHSIYTPKGA
jgi:predicted site-specific integrase-resolvase